jgi:hypothetical protein
MDIEATLATLVAEGAAVLAPGGPDVVLCELCNRSVIFHQDGCPNEDPRINAIKPLNTEWPLPQAIAQACIERGVVIDFDLLRATMGGVFSFAPIGHA